MSYSVDKTEEQWREELGEEQYAVLREAATEPVSYTHLTLPTTPYV